LPAHAGDRESTWATPQKAEVFGERPSTLPAVADSFSSLISNCLVERVCRFPVCGFPGRAVRRLL
jgi:hypothetical protein